MKHATPLPNKLSGTISDWQKRTGLPGVGVVIRDDSGMIFKQGFGVPDDAIIPVASQSKTLTAIAILQLIQKGAINKVTKRPLKLEDHLTDLLPMLNTSGLKEDWLKGVTLQDALTHKTRMGRGAYDKSGDARKILSSAELRNIKIGDIKPDKKPGYSNRAYNMLGLIVEDTAHMPFNDYITKGVVERYHLGEIYPSMNAVPEGKRSRILTGFSGPKLDVPVKEMDSAALTPCGGFFATAEAMSNLFDKLAKGKIFKDQTAADETGLWACLNTGSGWAGLGTQIRLQGTRDNNGEPNDYHVKGGRGKLYGHSGGLDGFQSESWHDPVTGITISLYRNGYWVPDRKYSKAEYERILNADNAARGTPLLVSKVFSAFHGAELAPAAGAGPHRPPTGPHSRHKTPARRKTL